MQQNTPGLIGALVRPGLLGLVAGCIAAAVYYLLFEGSGPPVPAVVVGIGAFLVDAHRPSRSA